MCHVQICPCGRILSVCCSERESLLDCFVPHKILNTVEQVSVSAAGEIAKHFVGACLCVCQFSDRVFHWSLPMLMNVHLNDFLWLE